MYDYAIIGAGVAGLKLALLINEDIFFKNKKILIIEKTTLKSNQKRWCYWEKGKGNFDEIVHHQWNKGKFIKKNTSKINLKMDDYHYKMILELDFYNYAKEKLAKNPNITWKTQEVITTFPNENFVIINTNSETFQSKYCFDSTIDKSFYQNNHYIKLLQHFKGYLIKFEDNLFNPESFTMMDFTASYQNKTSFMYFLPIKPNVAFIEFTLFTEEIIEDEIYDFHLIQYIKEKISKQPFEILEIEKGIIPMTNFPFQHSNDKRILKIGTAGGWVRPSTGYSFKKTDNHVAQIIKNLKSNQDISKNILNPKYMLYDTLLLSILKNENEKGPALFAEMYQKNKLDLIFKFLDGTTTLWEDIKVITSFKPFIFLRAIKREFF
jgi:lycopene beta-cyclase